MKKILWSFLVLFSCASCFAQNTPIVSAQAQVLVPPISNYGYPWEALAGSQRRVYASVYAEVDTVTNVARSGNTVTLTANNTMEAGDVIKLINFPDGYSLNYFAFVVASATPTTIVYQDYGSGTSSNAITGWVEKFAGPHWTGTGTWEVYSTVGSGETFRLYSDDGLVDTGFVAHPVVNGSYPHINFQVGPVAGAISTTGTRSAGNFAIHSTQEFVVKFTLGADNTKTGTYHWVVGANGGGFGTNGHVYVDPGYQQIFHGRPVPLESYVFGNTDQAVDWTIVDTPTGGNGSLVSNAVIDTHHPEAVFDPGTTGSGQYHIKACMHSSPTDCAELTVYVSPNNPPSANALNVEQVPCDIDPDAGFSNIFEVGPTQAHTTLLDFPQTYSGSSIARVHNEGAAGSPTVFHEYVQVNIPTSGTFTDRHPAFVLCGIPNPSTGELPIIDGQNAHGTSWSSQYVVAPYSIIGILGQTGPSYFTGVEKPFSYILVSNLFVRNVTAGFNYYDRDGVTIKPWGESMGIRPFGLQHYAQIGMRYDLVSDPIFDDANTSSPQWQGYSADVYYRGNHLSNYGLNGSFLSHPFYNQADRVYQLLNLEDGTVTGSQGTACYSSRGTHDVRKYNRCVASGGNSYPGGHSEIQDMQNGIDTDLYWGYNGATTCDVAGGSWTSLACLGQFGQGDWFAAMQEEHYLSNIDIGNAYSMPSDSNKFLGISTTHATVELENTMNSWYGYNTYLIGGQQQGESFGETQRLDTDFTAMGFFPVPYYAPTQFLQNNIIPWHDNTAAGYTSIFGTASDAFWFFRSNLVHPKQVTLLNPLHPQWGNYLHPYGLMDGWTWGNQWNIDPLNQHINGDQTQFIEYNVFPVSTTTLFPVNTSNAIGAATTPVGVFEQYKPYFNAADALMSPFKLRTDLSTMGAYDPQGAPTPVSFVLSPNPIAMLTGGTLTMGCQTTLSDTTTRNCFSPVCTSSNTASVTTSGTVLTSTAAVGTGTISCTADGLASQSINFTVTLRPPIYRIQNITYQGVVIQ